MTGSCFAVSCALKLNVEVDGDVEWIRTEVVTSPGVSDPLQRHRFEVTRSRNKPAKILRSELLRAREEHTLVPGKLKSTTRRGAKLLEE